MAENIGSPEILRDTDLEQKMLAAVIADRNDQPRSKQLQVGPSEVGGCRELLRAGLFESETVAEPETAWATAAHAGTVFGADLERIFGQRLSALEQQRITAMFGMLGIQISGGADVLFVDEDIIGDLKSNADIGGLLYDLKRDAAAIETLISIYREGKLFTKNIETADGGYELTQVFIDKISKLHYYVQISIYVMGAMQQGILTPDGEGRLIFYDRSGNYQDFIAVRVPPEQIAMFFAIAQMRIGQVLQTQSAYVQTGGNPAVLATLRDKQPSYCFSPKVQCPRRMHCWAGSDWTANNQITDPEDISAMNRYATGRDLEKLAKGMKDAARAELKERDVQGVAPDGKMLTWTAGGAINLVETTVKAPQAHALLNEYIPPADLHAEVVREQAAIAAPVRTESTQVDPEPAGVDTAAPESDTETPAVVTPTLSRADRYKALMKTGAPVVRRLANEITGIELKGLRKEDAIDAILNHEYPKTRDEPGSVAVPLADEAMQGGPAGDEAADLYQEQQREVEAAHQAGLAEDAAAWAADPHRISPLPGDEERDPRIDRVRFEPSEPDHEDAPPPPEDEPPLKSQEELDREDALRKLQRGPHAAPLLDNVQPTSVATDEPIILPDGSTYVPLENEDPRRPGLFFDNMGSRDRLRQAQYDSDPQFRARCLSVRQKFNGNTPASQK